MMCSMRMFLCLLVMIGQPGVAAAASTDDLLRTFASCAGRLTAQLEHQWLLQSDDAQDTEHQRAEVVALLSAIMPDDRGRQVLSWRTDARAAQRALLQRAQFGTDPDDAAWAARTAGRYVADCTGFLLS